MDLNFSDKKYVDAANEIALASKSNEEKTVHSPQDAFMFLIHGKSPEDLSNLCQMLNNNFYPELSFEQCYNLTQGIGEIFERNSNIVKAAVYSCALKCLNRNKYLGEKTISDGKINTSSWMSHCLYESKLAGELAEMLHLDPDKATTFALLHDYGRSFSHKFDHVTRGFEALIDAGWKNEASATLSHSFIDGGRCANCDPAEPGFYVDENGNACWENEENKDDVTRFLEEFQYDDYSDILNVADLMATSEGIVSPLDRLNDIATRKTPDPRNRSYFLAKFTNKLNQILVKMGEITSFEPVNAADDPQKIEQTFLAVSELFYNSYLKQRALLEQNRDQEN